MKEKTQGGERGGWMKIKASFMTFLREQSPRKKKKKNRYVTGSWKRDEV